MNLRRWLTPCIGVKRWLLVVFVGLLLLALAFAHMLHLDTGTLKNGTDRVMWVRSTVCCRRSGGRWLITHEHISMPFDPETLQPWVPPTV